MFVIFFFFLFFFLNFEKFKQTFFLTFIIINFWELLPKNYELIKMAFLK